MSLRVGQEGAVTAATLGGRSGEFHVLDWPDVWRVPFRPNADGSLWELITLYHIASLIHRDLYPTPPARAVVAEPKKRYSA